MDITVEMAMTVPGAAVLTTIIIQLVKANLPAKSVRYVAVLTGIVIATAAALVVVGLDKMMIAQSIINGFLAGASSIGLYELVKTPLNLASRADMP